VYDFVNDWIYEWMFKWMNEVVEKKPDFMSKWVSPSIIGRNGR